MADEITLASLVGEHLLSGVDFEEARVPAWEGSSQLKDAQTCRFCLDGKVYVAIEDPDDGYRSSMRSLGLSDATMKNTWEPVRVLASMRTKDRYGQESDVLEFRDSTTGLVVLEVGTENSNDYYPWFVAEFHPEALSHNAKK